MNYIKDGNDLEGKKVLLRLDLNVPITNGKITDETRINKILPIFNRTKTSKFNSYDKKSF